MGFTGKWGSSDDNLGNVVPGFGSFPSQVASDTLSLTQTVTVTKRSTRNVQASSDLVSLTQNVVLAKSQSQPVTQIINVTDFARIYRQIHQDITDTLSLSDSTEPKSIFASATQFITFTDEATLLRQTSLQIEDIIELSDLAQISTRDVKASSEIALTQQATAVGPIYKHATDQLQQVVLSLNPVTLQITQTYTGLVDVASASVVRSNVTFHQFISLSEHVIGVVVKASGTDVDASDTLSLSDKAQLSIQNDIVDPLTLTDVATAGQTGVPVSNILSLTDVASVQISHAATVIADTIAISQAVRFTIEHDTTRFEFSPFIGANSDPNAPTPPPATLPADSGITGFRLRFPSSGMFSDEWHPTRKPDFGNVHRFSQDRINRETRGGTLIVFADPIWPKTETLVLRFSALKKIDKDGLLDFMRDHLGQEIRLIDWENRAWTGIITNPNDPAIQDDRDSWTASFEFQGERE